MSERGHGMNGNEPIVIAQIIGKWLGGGVESVVMNYYRHIDRDKVQFDFLCDEDSVAIPFDEIKALGGKVTLIPPYQSVFRYHRQVKKILREGQYAIVHSHINTLSVFPLFAATCAGVPVRIAHSHSTTSPQEFKRNVAKLLLRPFAKLFATHYFACTEHAGRWLFGNRAFDKGRVTVMNNAIDLDRFKPNEAARAAKRRELGIGDGTLVLGHVGRFATVKNHDFLVDVFANVHAQNPDSVLLLVGQGPLEDEIKKKVARLGLADAVIFAGQRDDVDEYYRAMDVFLLPSLYEGLGMVLIEAQASGCRALASENVPAVAKATELLEFVPLANGAAAWAAAVLKNADAGQSGGNPDALRERYDIRTQAQLLEARYTELYRTAVKR